jgi:2-amino-4-hydroxy-6-hydroxymethyldihydropteridine diphosphokinase
MQEKKAYIGLGSNLGDSRRLLAEALELLDGTAGIRVLRVSSVYCTEPLEDREQPWFFNQAVCVAVDLPPAVLLDVLQDIEKSLGRVRGGRRFGPRGMDLDILLYGDMRMSTARLCLPHPRLRGRAFALVPLLEIEPELTLPDGRGLADLTRSLEFYLEGDKIRQKG